MNIDTKTQDPTRRGPSTRSRRSRTPGFVLQKRDVEIVSLVHALRVLSTTQIAALLFSTEDGATSSNCRRRLSGLVTAGYLRRHFQMQSPQDGRRPHLFTLRPKGVDLLRFELGMSPEDIHWKPTDNSVSWPFLAHQLALNDIYVQLATSAMPPGWELIEWVDDRVLKKHHTYRIEIEDRGELATVGVIPDAYAAFSIDGGQQIVQFFIEADRGTMATRSRKPLGHSWHRRVLAYNELFKSGALQQDYQARSMRVLTVTSSEKRVKSLKDATERAGGKTRYWFTWVGALEQANPFAQPIWHRAGDDSLCSIARHWPANI